METASKKNSIPKENKKPKNNLINEDMHEIDQMKRTPQTNKEAADLGYTVRNGTDPNRPNPDRFLSTAEQTDLDNLNDLDDDFHTDKDLEHDEIDEFDLEIENDELDNPSDVVEEDFNEIEDLEDLDQDDEPDQNAITEEDIEEDYPDNDPRKF